MGVLSSLLAEAAKSQQSLANVFNKYFAIQQKISKTGPRGSDAMKQLGQMIQTSLKSTKDLIAEMKDIDSSLDSKESVNEGEDMNEEDKIIPKLKPRLEDDNMDGEMGGYEDSLKDNIGDIVMDDSLDAEAKIAKLLALVGSEEEAMNGGNDKPMDEAEDVALEIGDEEKEEEEMPPLKTEESIRRRKDPALTKLMEEVDAYRARDRRDRLMGEARKLCENASLPKYAITEAFLGILSETEKKNWKALVEDRRRVIFRGEQPVSAVASNGELTVDSLVKALRS
jgi:hypothetical protein